MNRFFKHISLSLVLTFFFASVNTLCMFPSPVPVLESNSPKNNKNLISPANGDEQSKEEIVCNLVNLLEKDEHNKQDEQEILLNTMKLLIEKNQFYLATNMAMEAMMRNDASEQNIAYEIFSALFKKNQGFEKATSAACDAIYSNEDLFFDDDFFCNPRSIEIKASAFKLFEMLIGHNHSIEESIDAARYGIRHENTHMQVPSVKLYKQLNSKMPKL